MSTIYLKVKLKSLMEEAKIIRKEELRMQDKHIQGQLHKHRTVDVRNEARSTHLAYSILRGKARHVVEMPNSADPDTQSIIHMVRKYGEISLIAAQTLVKDWLEFT